MKNKLKLFELFAGWGILVKKKELLNGFKI